IRKSASPIPQPPRFRSTLGLAPVSANETASARRSLASESLPQVCASVFSPEETTRESCPRRPEGDLTPIRVDVDEAVQGGNRAGDHLGPRRLQRRRIEKKAATDPTSGLREGWNWG